MVKTNKKVDKREAHIKKKLTAAIMMLLISCIMTVTSTYAWFTLSTAPEITGVSTTVGANGNLEIALATTDTWSTPDSITSEADSSGDYTTWGNLVDLSNGYGLDKVTLYPAKLNVADSKVESIILSTPLYGADGRVTELAKNTYTGTYSAGAFKSDDTQRGVRAIGTVSAMSPRQLAFRSALAGITSNQSKALSIVSLSWNANGDTLAGLAVKFFASDTVELSDAEIASLNSLVIELEKAVNAMDASLINATHAYLASKLNSDNDTDYQTKADLLTGLGVSFKSTENGGNYDVTNKNLVIGGKTVAVPVAIQDEVTAFNDIATVVKQAKAINVSSSTAKDLFNLLMNPSYVEVNEMSASDFKNQSYETLIGAVVEGMTVSLENGSGVYYDIAEFLGNYNVTVTMPKGTTISYTPPGSQAAVTVDLGTIVGGKGVEVKIQTNAPKNETTPIIDALFNVMKDQSPENTGGTQDALLTTTYGYVIDFVLRTNAANSSVLLSTEAVNRVGESGTESTMGSGSTIIIEQEDNQVTNVNVLKGLLDCVRIVFVDGENTILAEGRIDSSTFDGRQASIKIWDGKATSALVCSNENHVHTHTSECGTAGAYTCGHTDTDSHGASCYSQSNGAFSTTNLITELPANTPQKMSAIVYLDGEQIDNADVVNATEAFTGTLNLQFASTADLKPMKYSDFREVPVRENVTETVQPLTLATPVIDDATGYKLTFTLPSGAQSLNYTITPDNGVTGEVQTSTNSTLEIELEEGATLQIWAVTADATKNLDSAKASYTNAAGD